MKIYFDACCLNRLTDDQSQERVRQEAEAVEQLLGLVTGESNFWISSVVLEAEISRNPDPDRREDARTLLAFAKAIVKLNGPIIEKARQLQSAGFAEFDALHLACAENAQVQIFLTTDDRVVRGAQRGAVDLPFRVLNPGSFLQEIRHADARND